MASAYFKQFAIENNLTVDYGFMFGKYKGFFINVKETLGTEKILTIMTNIGEDKEKLKEILSVFDENELPLYHIVDMQRQKNYVSFSFELPSARLNMITKFLDKFIESYISHMEPSIPCPICNNNIVDGEKTAILDSNVTLLLAHDSCFTSKRLAEIEAKKAEKEKQTASRKALNVANASRGPLGVFLYSLIYFALLVVSFFFMQFILNNADSEDTFVLVFQYAPCAIAFTSAPIITAGYDKFSNDRGTSRYITVFWAVIITTFVGTFFGFVASLKLIVTDSSIQSLYELVIQLITAGSASKFRWGFYVYLVVSVLISGLSFMLRFNSTKENDGTSGKFEKLE